jgi:hypothetical protein
MTHICTQPTGGRLVSPHHSNGSNDLESSNSNHSKGLTDSEYSKSLCIKCIEQVGDAWCKYWHPIPS